MGKGIAIATPIFSPVGRHKFPFIIRRAGHKAEGGAQTPPFSKARDAGGCHAAMHDQDEVGVSH